MTPANFWIWTWLLIPAIIAAANRNVTLFFMWMLGGFLFPPRLWDAVFHTGPQLSRPSSPLSPPTAPHKYLSTYCLHELHTSCRLNCKHCDSPCLCPCHHP